MRDIRDELEQYSRPENLEVHRLSQTENENLFDKLNEIAQSLGLAVLTRKDVEGLRRLLSEQDRIATVLVRFASRRTRQERLSKRGILRERKSGICFQENMTALIRSLFCLCLCLA